MHNTSDLVANELEAKDTPDARKLMLQFTYAHQNWNMDDWKNNAYNINLQSKTREYQKTKTQTSLI